MYKTKNSKLTVNFLLVVCIILATCFLSIGYADITSTNLGINLNVSTTTYVGMFISDVQYSSDNGADLTNSKIIDFSGTMLHSNIYLSSTNTSSSITYTVTIFNNSDATKKFTGVTYSDELYSNKDITYKITGLAENDIIEKGDSKTFDITFYYNNVTTISNNNLDSYLNFNFDYYLEGENEVDIDISSGDSYTFEGVSPENPVNLQDMATISFDMRNNSGNTITAIKVSLTYTTSTGSRQSATIALYDENDSSLGTQVAQFSGKQTNAVVTVTFSNLNIENGEKVSIKCDKSTITNGQVKISNITITPVF